MMKKMFKLCVLFLCSFFIFTYGIYAKELTFSGDMTLKEIKEDVAAYESKMKNLEAEKKKAQQKIQQIKDEIATIAETINNCEEEIAEAKKEIERLEKEIDNKQLEIDNLINFEQIASGDNVYLEYIFNAKSFTDFIYRASVVEQLTAYNDGLIDDMNNLIKENEKTQEELEEKIEDNEKNSAQLSKTLKSYNLSVLDISEEHEDAEQLYESAKESLNTFKKMYEEFGCKETDTIDDCMDAPFSDNLLKPTTKGKVTSEYGMRLHPTLGYYRMHQGIDIAVGMGTPVYASTQGIVTTVSKVKNPNKANSSCGGNAVYISHTVKGKKITTVYMHLHTINVKVGDYVLLNTVIGTSGGGEKYDYCTTGPHLHFGVKVSGSYVNPRNYINFPARYKNWSSRW